MVTAILAILMFLILIFPHELGHFTAAKLMGVKVNEFAFGMGPIILKRQKGETLYSIRLFPVGGFCAMEGEDESSDDKRAFNNKSLPAKLFILVAGVLMNVIICTVILIALAGIGGSPTTEVDKVGENTPAQIAGMEKGDILYNINGKKIEKWTDVSIKNGENSIIVMRNGKKTRLTVRAEVNEQGRPVIGINPKMSHGIGTAIVNGTKSAYNMTIDMYKGFYMLVTGKVSTDDVAGPVGIISLVGQTRSLGIGFYFIILAMMSMNLAVVNLLPLPALDGGRILILIVRKIVGPKFTDDMEGYIHAGGMVFLLTLMIFITFNDVVKLFR